LAAAEKKGPSLFAAEEQDGMLCSLETGLRKGEKTEILSLLRMSDLIFWLKESIKGWTIRDRGVCEDRLRGNW